MKNHPAKKSRVNLWKYFLVMIVVGAALLLAPAGARAEIRYADCGAVGVLDPMHHPTVQAALNAFTDPTVTNRLVISGTCTNQSIRIDGFSRLTVSAAAGGATLIHTNDCANPSGTASNVLSIVDSHQLSLQGFSPDADGGDAGTDPGGRLTITGGNGVSIEDSSVTIFGITVEKSQSGGIGVGNGSSLNLNGASLAQQNFLQDNCGPGLGVSSSSTAGVGGWNTIQGNRLGVGSSGRVNMGGGGLSAPIILIQNNLSEAANAISGGFISLSGGVIVQNNASDPDVTHYPAGMRAALVAYLDGTIQLGPNAQIQNNQGPAIWADAQSIVRLGPGLVTPPIPPNLSISGNTGGGVKLTRMSTGLSTSVAVLTGNTGSDASCDESSWLFGDTTGISKIKCSNTEKNKKKDNDD